MTSNQGAVILATDGPVPGKWQVVVVARGRTFRGPWMGTQVAAEKLQRHLQSFLDPWEAVIRLVQLRIYQVCNE